MVLPGLATLLAGASGATPDERRELRHGARAAVAARAAGVRRDLEEPRHGVHALGPVVKCARKGTLKMFGLVGTQPEKRNKAGEKASKRPGMSPK